MNENIFKEVFLHPGQIYAEPMPTKVITVLGSCVAVCIYDPVQKIGGMNHYMLPLWNGDGLPSPKYGNIAIPKLIEKMLLNGCRRENLKAKIFGGAAVINNNNGLIAVGDRNIALAKDMLKMERIEIVAASLGDVFGRKILFNTYTGEVLMKKVEIKNEFKVL
jgi:chemotaxis protein CheD